MKRRTLLGSIPIAALSGCLSQAGLSTPSPTSSPTPTPIPAPKVVDAGAVSEWEEIGDLEANRINTVRSGYVVLIGFRYEAFSHGGTNRVLEQVEVYSADGSGLVGREQSEEEQLTSGTGMGVWEHAVAFNASDWSDGKYRIEVAIRDEVTGRVSDPYEATFEIDRY